MKLRELTVMKALAFIMAVAAFAAAAMMGWYQLANYDVLWGRSDVSEGYTVRYLERMDSYSIHSLVNISLRADSGTELSAYEAQTKSSLESELSAGNTNLRWQVMRASGEVLYSNTEEQIPAQAAVLWSDIELNSTWEETLLPDVEWQTLALEVYGQEELPEQVSMEDWESLLEARAEEYRSGSAEVDPDLVYTDPEGRTNALRVVTADGTVCLFAPTVRAVMEANQFGYRYEPGAGWSWEEGYRQTEYLDVAMWLDSGLRVDDQYALACQRLASWNENREAYLALTILCLTAGLLLTVYLCAAAGHKRGVPGIWLNWFHRIPGDLLLAAFVLAAVLFACVAAEVLPYRYTYVSTGMLLLAAGGVTAGGAALCMAVLVTLAARCKSHTLLRNTVIWRLCRWCAKKIGRIFRALPLVRKAVLVSVVYLLFSIVFVASNEFLWGIATIILLAYLCLWAYQWKKIRQGTREIIGGNTDYKIDTRRMLPDLKAHADELNNLGQSISTAVEERMRSEHFKAELITNVSHDLKTPLTSIINYVDLLKKEDIGNPKAAEYIEVLDRKSQRLKKLTEDLVEASKASTGSLTVVRERLDLGQLVDQALAEYEDRLAQKGLTVVRTLPEKPVWVEADGRHLWRVIDNLLSNCAKYALEGTRVYAEVQQFSDCAALSIKNISRDELNVPPEMLMERFVRGDESRTAEGSGLGLSIAQSLTDLQHGQFRISIDGDLFKAIVTLPLAEAPMQE